MSDTGAGGAHLPLVTIVEAARRTGVDALTLRAWERRYGVPRPARTPAGYRLYNARDLREIAALVAYRAAGIAVRQAAFLIARQRTLAPESPAASPAAGWRRRLERACLRFDDGAATGVLAEASTMLRASTVLETVVFPVVATLGAGRESGVISVSQEHFASELARRLVARHDAMPPALGAAVVLTGCAPGELHELGLLSVVCQLRDAGQRVVHLGANVPVTAFLSTVDAVRPRTTIVAVTMAAHLEDWFRRRTAVAARVDRGVRFVWAGPGAAVAKGRLPGLVSASMAEVVTAVCADGIEHPPGWLPAGARRGVARAATRSRQQRAVASARQRRLP